jgi:hypothetical protein
MQISTTELLDDLQRLEQELGRFPTANDVVRDGEHNVLTYYRRIDWNWRTVESTYRTWDETGTIPETAQQTDWSSLNHQLRKSD